MARRGRGCVAPGCDRRAEPGTVVCIDHRWTALGSETEREVRLMTQRLTAMDRLETAEARKETARLFRQQVLRGEYAAVFGAKFEEMLTDSGKERDLTGEIGMLRIAMRRVLTEEEEPTKMAHGLAKLSGALAQAVRLQDTRELTMGDAQDQSLAEILNEILMEIEEEAHEIREPWEVDPYRPSGALLSDLKTLGLEPGSMEAAAWVDRWRLTRTRELAEKGSRAAQMVLANGGMGMGMLGSGG